jgi:hypothetical protein
MATRSYTIPTLMEDAAGRAPRRLLEYLIPALLTAAFLLLRSSFPPRSLDSLGLAAIRDDAMSLMFWSVIVSLGVGLGETILDRLDLVGLSRLESKLFGFALGLGLISLLIMGLGLAGLLNQLAIALIVVIVSAVAGPRIFTLWRSVGGVVRSLPARWRAASPLARAAGLLAAVIGLLTVAQSLTPPWDYDGLMYHLVGPRMFLQAGRIFPYPDNWYVNGPFSIEMLFSIGMAFGDDVLPKLIHLGFGFALVGATYAAGRRWLPEGRAWLAPAILLTVPTLPIFSAFAYIDLGWSTYELLAVLAVVLWWESRSERWLLLGGLMIGWAMGSKYLGLEGFALLGLLVVFLSLKEGLPTMIRRGLVVGLPAACVALPWYLKNALWFGNPVYPLYFGGPEWDATRLRLYSAYLDSFGVGRTPLAYLLLPVNVYVRHVSFGAVMNRIDIPSVLFPLAIGYPLTRRARPLSILLVVAAARFIVWAAGSQQTRFLLAIYPILALAAAHVMIRVTSRLRPGSVLGLFGPLLTVGLLAITLFYQVVLNVESAATVVGLESKAGFLSKTIHDFQAVRFIEDDLPSGSKALLLGDGQGYYCPTRCIPDPDHFRWSLAIDNASSRGGLGEWFSDAGITHILFSREDFDFLLQHDPEDVVHAAYADLVDWSNRGCLRSVFEGELASVLEIRCTE